MANTAAICTSFKKELLLGYHAFGATLARSDTTLDSFKAALYYTAASPSIDATTTVYTTTGEVVDASYAAAGAAVTNASAPTTSGTTAFWTPSASIAWTTLTAVAFDAVLLYNVTHATKYAVAVFTFGSQTVTAGNFTLTMPTNDASSGLLRLA